MTPVIIFDTSGLNRLADDTDSACLLAGLKSGYFTRLTETNLGEIAATSDRSRQQRLLQLCRRLLPAGEVILPYQEIIKELVKAHSKHPASFNYQSIPIKFPEGEQVLRRQGTFADELAEQQRTHARKHKRAFSIWFDRARPHLEQLFRDKKTERPKSFKELVTRLQVPSGAFWDLGQQIYGRAAEIELDEDTIRKFTDDCPPFRALILSIYAALYERCIREMQSQKSYRAGSFDLYSSVYLPYCSQYVTADQRQLNALDEVATVGNLQVAVLSCDDFRQHLTLDGFVLACH